jgi:hypothetical protein
MRYRDGRWYRNEEIQGRRYRGGGKELKGRRYRGERYKKERGREITEVQARRYEAEESRQRGVQGRKRGDTVLDGRRHKIG